MNSFTGNEVAIIGMAGRFPGAKTLKQFWQNLHDGVESITSFTSQELLQSGVEHTSLSDPEYVRARAILDDVDLFDADFFGYSPREAELIDPQQRLFLECAWEALEVAGYINASSNLLVGVYAGVAQNLYVSHEGASLLNTLARADPLQIQIGNQADFLASRVSYKLNLRGPSVVIQSACSSSLTAVHLACQSLLVGECDIALAGGVSITIPQVRGYQFRPGSILSPDGHCRPFDANAQGTVEGNGLGIVVLKRLDRALLDGDTLLAVIKGSAVNNDGALKVGYTAPGIHGQAAVIREALTVAGVSSQTISYVEAHGTGTRLGDPVELAALQQAFGYGHRNGPCAIGSVKSNIGHLNSAAGIAGLIKTVLCLQKKILLPSLHFEAPNPEIDFKRSQFFISSEVELWEGCPLPRRAGVSSFGMGGTNAHVVLEEAPAPPDPVLSRRWQMLIHSAKTSSALAAQGAALSAFLRTNPDVALDEMAYTLQIGRKAFPFRQAIICNSSGDALQVLSDGPATRRLNALQVARDRSVVFLFPGQGSQFPYMAEQLYRTEGIFRNSVDTCCDTLRTSLGLDLRDVLYPDKGHPSPEVGQLQETWLTQPALFVIEFALAQLWISWGVRPTAMLGHSIGEYVAACLSGVLSLEDALHLVSARGRLMHQLPEGGMVAILLPEAEALSLLSTDDSLDLAAVNGKNQCVIAGSKPALTVLMETLESQGIPHQRLNVSHAFHSAAMDPILTEFMSELKKVKLSPPLIPYVSNVTGQWISSEQATSPEYWVAHLRRTVRFADGLQTLLESVAPVLLEVGPGHVLTTLASQNSSTDGSATNRCSLPLHDQIHELEWFTLRTLGQIWLDGVDVDWEMYWSNKSRRRIPLPTYPFERKRYWLDELLGTGERPRRQTVDPRIGDILPFESWFHMPVWQESLLSPADPKKLLLAAQERWLVFRDSAGVADLLVPRLIKDGQFVVAVSPGAAFEQKSQNSFVINPSTPSDYDLLLTALSDLHLLPTAIIHLWSLGSHHDLFGPDQWFESCQAYGFYSLLFLTKAVVRSIRHSNIRMWVISDGLHDLTGNETLFPEKSTLLGPCNVIPQEHPHISCDTIDVLLPTTSMEERQLGEFLYRQLGEPPSGSRIAYRMRRRWVQAFQQCNVTSQVMPPSRLVRGGVYLITGGLGQIGLTLAAYLAKQFEARLVLVGRRIPASSISEIGLADGAWNNVASQLREIENLASGLLLVRADVADEQAMKEVIQAARDHFGNLHGVIHAAGVGEDEGFQTVLESTIANCESHFHPKVHGLISLERAIRVANVDFCVLISSLASICGGLGFSAYAAANAFMDSSAASFNRTHATTWITANFDGWTKARSTQGSIFRAASVTDALTISPDEGQRAFAVIVSLPQGNQIAISTQDLEKRRRVPKLQWEGKSVSPSLYPRPQISTLYNAPSDDIERSIADIWQSVLGVQTIGVDDDFFELGGHSLLAIQIIGRLRDMFSLDVPLRAIFEARTIAGLSKSLEHLIEGQS